MKGRLLGASLCVVLLAGPGGVSGFSGAIRPLRPSSQPVSSGAAPSVVPVVRRKAPAIRAREGLRGCEAAAQVFFLSVWPSECMHARRAHI
jgi:hypothetical protein